MADTTQSDYATPSVASQETATANPSKKMFDYHTAKPKLSACISNFSHEAEETKVRRKLRNIDVDIKKMKQEGKLDAAETYIPIRTIETNISQEKPPFISYMKQPQRLMIFTPQNEPLETDCRKLEIAFTKGMTYSGWELAHFKNLDGAQVHGWDFIEVMYSPKYPLKCCIEHVGHDNLIFDTKDCIDIQYAEFIMRKYSVSIEQLKEFVSEYDFDPIQINKVIEASEDKSGQRNKNLYKTYFKSDGVVQVAWWMDSDGIDNWVKAPQPAFVGIKQKVQVPVTVPGVNVMGLQLTQDRIEIREEWQVVPLTIYPIFPLYYTITEAPKIVDRKGRVFLDEFKQEAQTALATSYVNGNLKAQKIFGSPKNDDQGGTKVKNVEISLIKNGIIDKPYEFWSFPYPSAEVLRGIQYFDVQNQNETGKTNFAVVNREDSRKTAKEISSAENQSAQLTSVQVILFSIYMRQTYSFVWKIVQSQALQYDEKTGEGIKFCQIPMESVDQMGNRTVVYVNDVNFISRDFDLRPAGDIDFIQRQFTIQNMMSDWPVVATIPGLREVFLADLMRLKYAEKGEQYAGLVQQSNQMLQMAQQAIGVIDAAMTTEEFKASSPENQQQTAQLSQMMKQMIGGTNEQPA